MNITNETINEINECINVYDRQSDYQLGLRIGSIFILLVCSFIGVATPTFVKWGNWKTIDQILFVGKFFGAGVITATGFIHIFPAAVETLADPCLPYFFQVYSASAGLFALISVLFTHLVEYIAQNMNFKTPGKSDSDSETLSLDTTNNTNGHTHSLAFSSHRNRVAIYILEAGIAVHSIIIGVDLGLSGVEFKTLLVALVFHQFFEGIGLGYKLSELKFKNIFRPLINSLVYSCTTPLGVVIGILSHVNMSPTDYSVGRMAKGITDAMAAGILIYVSLVTMLNEEFSSESFRKLPVKYKIINFMALYCGAILMSLIGIWA
jgi:zinc transporter 1/2/3